MMRLMRGTLLLLAAGAVGGLLDWGPSSGFSSAVSAKPPGPKGRGPKGPEQGKDHLQKAYDDLTDVSVWMNVDRARPPRDTTKLFDRAKTLYRDAVKASREDEGPRAAELGLAAHDAARGLMHALRADAPAAVGLPAPPPREDDELEALLRRTRDRLEDAGDADTRGPGREFLDAVRRLYDQARKADRDDGARAIQWARAAEAWTHVGEHLDRADDRDVPRPDPERRRPQPPEEGPRRPRPPRPQPRRTPATAGTPIGTRTPLDNQIAASARHHPLLTRRPGREIVCMTTAIATLQRSRHVGAPPNEPRVSAQSRLGLNAANFFLAEVTGVIVPFLSKYLVERGWTDGGVGMAVALGGLGVFLMQTPAGFLVDRIRQRRALLAGASLLLGLCYGLLPLLPARWTCLDPLLFVGGISQAFFAPLLGALALGLAGHAGLNRLMGANQSCNHAGNLAAALVAIVLVAWLPVTFDLLRRRRRLRPRCRLRVPRPGQRGG